MVFVKSFISKNILIELFLFLTHFLSMSFRGGRSKIRQVLFYADFYSAQYCFWKFFYWMYIGGAIGYLA